MKMADKKEVTKMKNHNTANAEFETARCEAEVHSPGSKRPTG